MIGTSDPYVIISYKADGDSDETRVGKSLKLNNNENPTWPDVFEFNYNPSTHPVGFQIHCNHDLLNIYLLTY